jgi:hypothetical protein
VASNEGRGSTAGQPAKTIIAALKVRVLYSTAEADTACSRRWVFSRTFAMTNELAEEREQLVATLTSTMLLLMAQTQVMGDKVAAHDGGVA